MNIAQLFRSLALILVLALGIAVAVLGIALGVRPVVNLARQANLQDWQLIGLAVAALVGGVLLIWLAWQWILGRAWRQPRSAAYVDRPSKEEIAILVIVVSGVLLFIATILITVSPQNGSQVFTGIVGLVGAWVGAIIAFYFGRENFDAASASVQKMVETIGPEDRLRRTPARQVMIPRAKSRSGKFGFMLRPLRRSAGA